MAKKEKELAAAKDEKLMDEKFELDLDALNKVAGGGWIGLEDGNSSCLEHDWEFIRREEGLWGYNAYYRCRKCGKEDYKWD